MVVIRQIDAAYVQDNSGVITPYRLIEATGLSTDTKPTANVASNSLFYELDTKKVYYYANDAWAEVGEQAHGGSAEIPGGLVINPGNNGSGDGGIS